MEEKLSLVITLPESLAGLPIRFEVNSGCRNIALNLESSTPIKKKYLLIWNQTDYLKVDDEDILWIKADGSYSCIHFKDGNKMMVSINLTNIMKDLPTEKFMRIHRSYIVNIGNIESIAGNCVRMNGQYIPIGREYRKDFFQRFLLSVSERIRCNVVHKGFRQFVKQICPTYMPPVNLPS